MSKPHFLFAPCLLATSTSADLAVGRELCEVSAGYYCTSELVHLGSSNSGTRLAEASDLLKQRNEVTRSPNDTSLIVRGNADEQKQEETQGMGNEQFSSDAKTTSYDPDRGVPEAFAPPEVKWIARFNYWRTAYSGGRDDRDDYQASVRRYWKRASLALEYGRARRFSRWDDAFALDAYVDLWHRAYANLAVQFSPDHELYPDYVYRAEIWQGLPYGWEPSLSFDHRQRGGRGTDIYGIGLGKYWGNWYFRWKTRLTSGSVDLDTSHQVLARYFYKGDADNFVELSGGVGITDRDILRGGARTVLTDDRKSIGAAWQAFITPKFGIRLSGAYRDEDAYLEREIKVGVLVRW